MDCILYSVYFEYILKKTKTKDLQSFGKNICE